MPTVLYNGFEWDEAKAAANEAKHGVSFTEAEMRCCQSMI